MFSVPQKFQTSAALCRAIKMDTRIAQMDKPSTPVSVKQDGEERTVRKVQSSISRDVGSQKLSYISAIEQSLQLVSGCLSLSREFYSLFFVDINECEDFNGGCSQRCSNFPGSFRCLCEDGYFMHSNKRDCGGRETSGEHLSMPPHFLLAREREGFDPIVP